MSEEAGGPAYEGPIGCEVPPDPDCILDPNGPGGFNPNSFLPNANSIGLLYAKTQQTPEDLNSAPAAEGDNAHSRAGVANIFLTSGGAEDEPQPQSLHVSAANAFATVKCVPDDDGTGLEPQLDSRSQVVYARLATNPLDVIPGILPPGETGPDEGGADPPAGGTNTHDHFDLGDARVHFNHVHRDTFVDAEGDTHNRITQQAVVLQQDHTADPNDPDFDPNANQSAIVLAEAVADFEGNPCEEAQGRITIVKDAEPEDPQDFRFQSNVEDFGGVFELDDDGVEGPLQQETPADEQQPSRASFDRPPADDYFVTEDVVPGWELEDIECEDPSDNTQEDEANRTANIDLAAGEEVICTFKNVKEEEAQVTVVKETDPEQQQDFEFRLQCEEQDENDDTDEEELCDERFQLDDDGNDQGAGPETDGDDDLPNSRTFTVPAPSEIEIREEEQAGFTTTVVCRNEAGEEVDTEVEDDGREVEFDIEPGDHVTCTFRNVQDDEDEGQVKVVKDTVPDSNQRFDFRFRHDPDDEGERTEAQFQLQDNGNENDGVRSSRTFEELDAGEVRVREDEVDGFTTTSECKDDATGQVLADEDGDPARVRFQLGEDQQVTCTFTNTAEQAPPPPPQTGRITIVKDTVPNDPQDFRFTGVEDGDGQFELDDDGVEGQPQQETDADQQLPSRMSFDRAPGEHTVTEGEVEGFELEEIECEDPSDDSEGNEETRTATINLAAGEEVVCTFTNEAVEEEPEPQPGTGTIEIRKDIVDADKDGSPVFHFVGDLGEFDLSENDESGVPDRIEFENIAAGQYEVTEEDDPQDGFELFRIRCQGDEDGGTPEQQGPAFPGGDNTARIDLDAGEDIRCRFLNTTDGNDPGNSGPGNADPEDDDNSGSGSGGGGGNSGPGRLASRAF